jgi:hypothetical protein
VVDLLVDLYEGAGEDQFLVVVFYVEVEDVDVALNGGVLLLQVI